MKGLRLALMSNVCYLAVTLIFLVVTVRYLVVTAALRENCPNTEFFLVDIFLYSDWIQENRNQKRLRTWTLFTQCWLLLVNWWLLIVASGYCSLPLITAHSLLKYEQKAGVLQAYKCLLCDKCFRREYFFNKHVEYCESVT